jgi:hypothetical protein
MQSVDLLQATQISTLDTIDPEAINIYNTEIGSVPMISSTNLAKLLSIRHAVLLKDIESFSNSHWTDYLNSNKLKTVGSPYITWGVYEHPIQQVTLKCCYMSLFFFLKFCEGWTRCDKSVTLEKLNSVKDRIIEVLVRVSHLQTVKAKRIMKDLVEGNKRNIEIPYATNNTTPQPQKKEKQIRAAIESEEEEGWFVDTLVGKTDNIALDAGHSFGSYILVRKKQEDHNERKAIAELEAIGFEPEDFAYGGKWSKITDEERYKVISVCSELEKRFRKSK